MKKLNPKTATKAEIRQADIDGLIGKKVKLPKLSKKVLFNSICEKTGESPADLASLLRANIATLEWIEKKVS